jgi:hypothetical protein
VSEKGVRKERHITREFGRNTSHSDKRNMILRILSEGRRRSKAAKRLCCVTEIEIYRRCRGTD